MPPHKAPPKPDLTEGTVIGLRVDLANRQVIFSVNGMEIWPLKKGCKGKSMDDLLKVLPRTQLWNDPKGKREVTNVYLTICLPYAARAQLVTKRDEWQHPPSNEITVPEVIDKD